MRLTFVARCCGQFSGMADVLLEMRSGLLVFLPKGEEEQEEREVTRGLDAVVKLDEYCLEECAGGLWARFRMLEWFNRASLQEGSSSLI